MNELESLKLRKDALDQDIDCHYKNIALLLDFATGYKKLSWTRPKLRPYQKDNLRLISTLKNLHIQIRELEKESDLLHKMLRKAKEKAA